MIITGKCSTFGGPLDTGVGPHEGLALISSARQHPDLFLPDNGLGLARRLNPDKFYIACRWDYHQFPVSYLLETMVTVSANNKSIQAWPADWGPNARTGRIADLSPGLAHALGVGTGSTVSVNIPERGQTS